MKKNDIAVLILIASISLVISFFLVKALFGEPKNDQTKVEVAESVSATVVEPSPLIFNKGAINPTVVIQIGSPSNQPPFSQ